MKHLDRITFDPLVMGGKPCIRGMRKENFKAAPWSQVGDPRASDAATFNYAAGATPNRRITNEF